MWLIFRCLNCADITVNMSVVNLSHFIVQEEGIDIKLAGIKKNRNSELGSIISQCSLRRQPVIR